MEGLLSKYAHLPHYLVIAIRNILQRVCAREYSTLALDVGPVIQIPDITLCLKIEFDKEKQNNRLLHSRSLLVRSY